MNIAHFLMPKCNSAYLFEDYSLRQGLEKMKYHGYSAIPVISREGKYIGTISEGDFLWFLLLENEDEIIHIDIRDIENKFIRDILNRDKYKPVSIMSPLEDVFEMAMSQNFVPVVDDRGYFMGIITRQTIMKYFFQKRLD